MLNILNKGYLSLYEDKEAFYDGIQELLDSDIFNKVYNEIIRNQILQLISLTNQRLANKIDILLKKKHLTYKEMNDIWEINTDLEYFGSFLTIPDEKIQSLKNFIRSNESHYGSYCLF